MASPQLDKSYPCLTCKQEIKLARKDDNTGWEDKFNLDGSCFYQANQLWHWELSHIRFNKLKVDNKVSW